ncbi:hypothetical protein F5887DRAFT_923226 [Amanita rubescens]|nr:hypothetical protein F5887DRAFT_923226 [Amanita rubescens]
MFKALAIVVTFAGLLVSALPHLEARQFAAPINFTRPNNERFFTCTQPFFGGQCAFQHINTGQCQDLPAQFQNSIQSARPDPGFNCTLYTGNSCVGDTMFFTFPYYNVYPNGFDYGSFPAKVNSNTKSFECVRSGIAPPGITGAGTGIFNANSQ